MIRPVLYRAVARWPSAALVAADVASALTPSRGTSAETLQSLVPGLDAAGARAASRASWTANVRSRVLAAGLRSPGARWPYPPLAEGPSPAKLEPPVVLGTLHLGPIDAIGAVLERLPGPVLALTRMAYPPRPGVQQLFVETDESHRTAAMLRAVMTLRADGHVFLAADGIGGRAVPATVLGRPVWFARGPFALARITGAPLLPVAGRWDGRRIAVVAGERIAPADEDEMATQLAAWYEDLVAAFPHELSPLGLAWLGALDR